MHAFNLVYINIIQYYGKNCFSSHFIEKEIKLFDTVT